MCILTINGMWTEMLYVFFNAKEASALIICLVITLEALSYPSQSVRNWGTA